MARPLTLAVLGLIGLSLLSALPPAAPNAQGAAPLLSLDLAPKPLTGGPPAVLASTIGTVNGPATNTVIGSLTGVQNVSIYVWAFTNAACETGPTTLSDNAGNTYRWVERDLFNVSSVFDLMNVNLSASVPSNTLIIKVSSISAGCHNTYSVADVAGANRTVPYSARAKANATLVGSLKVTLGNTSLSLTVGTANSLVLVGATLGYWYGWPTYVPYGLAAFGGDTLVRNASKTAVSNPAALVSLTNPLTGAQTLESQWYDGQNKEVPYNSTTWFSSGVVIPMEEPPSPPFGLGDVGVTQTTVTIGWQNPSQPDLLFNTVSWGATCGARTNTITSSTPIASMVIGPLQPNEGICVGVTVSNPGGSSGSSTTYSAVTLAAPTASASSYCMGDSCLPVAPNLLDPLVQYALTHQPSPIAGQATLVQTDRIIQNLTTSGGVTSTPCCTLTLHSAWANVTNATPAGWTFVSGTTWVNFTQSCGYFTCPTAPLVCDGTSYPGFPTPVSYRLNRPCDDLTLAFNNATLFYATNGPAPMVPAYHITRQITYLSTQWVQWLTGSAANSRAATLGATILGAAPYLNGTPMVRGPYAKGAWASFFSFNTTDTAWVIPFPSGIWQPSLTTLTYLNTTGRQDEFAETLQDVVVQWQNPPAGVQNYTVTVYGLSRSSSLPGYGNASSVGTVSLDLENISSPSPGVYEATGQWTNGGTLPFNGTLRLTGSWAQSATNTEVRVNGQTEPSQWTGSAVEIPTGQLTVQNGTTVTVAVLYQKTSAWSFASVLFDLNSWHVTYLGALLALAVVVGLVLAFLHFNGRIKTDLLTFESILGMIVLVAFWVAL